MLHRNETGLDKERTIVMVATLKSRWHYSGPKDCWADDVLKLVCELTKDKDQKLPNLMRLTKSELMGLQSALSEGVKFKRGE